MNDHDIDLIVDLIESRLSASEAETALARIMEDPDLSASYAEQLSVRASLDAVPVAAMTADEKLALNEALVTQLRLEDGPAVVPIVRKRKQWWAPVVGITAAAAAVTAIFIVPGMSGSDDAASDTTIVASAAAEAPAEQDKALEPAGATGADGAEEFGDVAESLDAADAPVSVLELEGADLIDVLDATAGESSPEAVEDALSALGFTGSASVSSDMLETCISDISSQLPPNTTDVVVFGVDTSGPVQIAHLGLIFDDGIGAALSVNLDTCTVVDLGN